MPDLNSAYQNYERTSVKISCDINTPSASSRVELLLPSLSILTFMVAANYFCL